MNEHRLWISIFFGFLPGILWLIYFYRKDTVELEPKKKIIKAYFIGIGLAFPVILAEWIPIQFVLANLPGGQAWSVVLLAPVVEELFKFFAVWYWFYRDPEFDEPMDGIVYATSVALGFASIENAGYVLWSFEVGDTGATIVVRAFLTVPGHALFAGFYGVALGMKKFGIRESPTVPAALVAAMVAHGIFNLSAYAGGLGILFLTLFVMRVLWKIMADKIQVSLRNSPHLDSRNS